MGIYWNEEDLEQFAEQCQAQELVELQLARFRNGVEPVHLIDACIPSNGILTLSKFEVEKYAMKYANETRFSRIKFVPASGAASRMFKHLFDHDSENELYQEFIHRVSEFPFFMQLKNHLEQKGEDIDLLREKGEWKFVVDTLLGPTGLHFASLPKGAIPFHFTNRSSIIPFEEHVLEALAYAHSSEDARVHYTVGDLFSQQLEDSLRSFAKQEGAFNQRKVKLGFSKQYPETDTIAVDAENNPFRNDEGRLVFRPGGHGALLANLQAIEEDVVFIKNIDNVLPSDKRVEHDLYKKAIAGYLIWLVDQRNALMKELDQRKVGAAEAVVLFLNQFSFSPLKNLSFDDLRAALDAPIRIAGMVRNQGEPGGGPFWVKSADGSVKKQIIEKAQIDLQNTRQAEILNKSTHFNPVDLVCHFKNEKGERYDLQRYSDLNQAFISTKFMNGRSLKALEHPGLWNGSMAKWLTVFIEVPLATFAPVKTVNDLLREAHR